MEKEGNANKSHEQQGKNINTSKNDFKIYKTTIIVLIVIVGVLVYMLLTTYRSLDETTAEKFETVERNQALEWELDSLMHDYTVFKHQHDSILQDKDSIIQENRDEIESLLARQEDYHRIRRRLDYLRDITQDYVMRIDSLYRVAEVLRVERDEAQEEAKQVRNYASELEKDREELSSKVEQASALSAYQISAKSYRTRGFTGREVENDRAGRVEYVEICFTIAENPVATPGEKNVYVRLACPDENILRVTDSDEYSFVHNKDTLQFSMSKQVNYQNSDKRICMEWDQTTNYKEGTYLVSIYTDEFRLGETAFTLR